MRIVAILSLVTLVACGGNNEPAAPASTAGDAPSIDAELLHKADVADGKEDKVVSKCASCALGMDGDPQHAAQVGDYTLEFCSESCAMRMESEPEKIEATIRKAVGGS